jgi:cytolysin (calcineurin-like family phosphatase)
MAQLHPISHFISIYLNILKISVMKTIFLMPLFCFLFFTQTTLIAQNENLNDEGKTKETTPSTVALTPEFVPSETEVFITLYHQGLYIAKYEVLYDEDGVGKKLEFGYKTQGWRHTHHFSSTVTNIRLKSWAATGLVLNPWSEIYNKPLQPSDLNKCYRNTGTTLNRQWDNLCQK